VCVCTSVWVWKLWVCVLTLEISWVVAVRRAEKFTTLVDPLKQFVNPLIATPVSFVEQISKRKVVQTTTHS
jgi:hypothetical protein